MSSFTRLDVCRILFPNTSFNNNSTRKVFNFILYPFALRFPWFFAVLKGNKRANRESSSCSHLGAIYLTYFARSNNVCSRLWHDCEIFTAVAKEPQRGRHSLVL